MSKDLLLLLSLIRMQYLSQSISLSSCYFWMFLCAVFTHSVENTDYLNNKELNMLQLCCLQSITFPSSVGLFTQIPPMKPSKVL